MNFFILFLSPNIVNFSQIHKKTFKYSLQPTLQNNIYYSITVIFSQIKKILKTQIVISVTEYFVHFFIIICVNLKKKNSTC